MESPQDKCFTEPIWNLSKKEAAAKERDLTISNSDFLGKGWNMLKPSNSESCSLAAEGSSTEFRCGWSTLKHVETCWSDAAHACSNCFMHVPNCFIFAREVQCRDLLLSFHQTVLGSQTLHRGNRIKHLDLQHLLPRVLQLLALHHHILVFLQGAALCILYWWSFTFLAQTLQQPHVKPSIPVLVRSPELPFLLLHQSLAAESGWLRLWPIGPCIESFMIENFENMQYITIYIYTHTYIYIILFCSHGADTKKLCNSLQLFLRKSGKWRCCPHPEAQWLLEACLFGMGCNSMS